MAPRARRPIVSMMFVILFIFADASDGFAQKFDEKFEHWPVNLKINGRLIVNNGMEDFSSIKPLLERIVKDKQVVRFDFEQENDGNKLGLALQETIGDNGDVKLGKFSELKAAFVEADVVVLNPGPKVLDYILRISELKPEMEQFIKDGKTLIVDSQTAGILGERILNGNEPGSTTGLNLLPNCVLSFGDDDLGESKRQLLSVLALYPRSVGIGVDDGTLLMLSGRKFTCYGDGKTTFLLMANERKPLRIESIAPRNDRRQRPQDVVVDLTEWRRDAIDRTLRQFPAENPEKPFVENGTLLIVGGGGLPTGLMDRFVELAGGTENAKLVFVPCAESDGVGNRQSTVESWKHMGVKHATFIHTKDREQSNSDEDFLAPLKDATGIWFGGGRQWNLADSYYGTKAHELMKEVLQRGGVIGGSSAGASIQGRYLARATPIGNFRIMAPGYERGGLGFVSGVAIDQHFSQRGRQKDMTQLVGRYPQLLGIGLDEATAIIVRKSTAEVVGRGRVHFFDRNRPVYADQPDYIALPSGSSYDLSTRTVINDATEESDSRGLGKPR